MKCKTGKQGNSGFTLVEVLAATGILVILLALGTVAVIHYARWLKITELDNTAREIYLAAENRALLLITGGRLEDSVVDAEGKKLDLPEEDGGTGISLLAAGDNGVPEGDLYYIYYDSSAPGGADVTILSDLLPRGTIDPALRDGRFYVVYDVYSGSVTDVFYAEEDGLLEADPNKVGEFYLQWRNTSRSDRLGAKKMIGYYGGESAGLGDGAPLSPPSILIINGEELQVQLVYNAPMGETVTPEVRLAYGGAEIDLMAPNSPASPTTTVASTGSITTYTYTWVVDTLAPGTGRPQFKDLFQNVADGTKPAAFGGDFTVTAKLTQGGFSSPEVSDEDNSLFAEGSGEGTAYIENLRHLQNLDKEFSKVTGKTAAEQIADIDCAESIFVGYEFVPIKNVDLVSYCGSHKEEGETEAVTHFIKGLMVTEDSVSERSGGLFSEVYGTPDAPWEFRDVRLINTSVTAVEKIAGGGNRNIPAGALVGMAFDASFENCWVYWEPEDQGDLIQDGTIQYQIIGSTSGGMVGMLEGGTIENCLAATLVNGNDIAGGLIGSTSGTVEVSHSYADCYLTGKTVAGLIGNVESGSGVALNDVYTAGFIYNGENSVSAGLCNGTVTARNAYAVMHYDDTTGNITSLADGVDPDRDNCRYLQYANSKGGMSYKAMIETGFVDEMNGDEFESKTPDQSHPYNLLEGMALTVYPFPGLKDLPHYGDWNAEFVTPALVYFEQYQRRDGTSGYGFYGGNVSCLSDDCVVPLDGYAVALRKEDVDVLADSFTITYRTGSGAEGKATPYTKDDLYEVEYDGKTYFLAPLPDELINSTAVSTDFYQYLSFQIEGDDPIVSAYCPHFAKTAVAMPTSMEEAAFMESMVRAADSLRTFVRTPRHLHMLSKYPGYYHTDKLGRQYTFLQELDLDYTTYNGYGLFDGGPVDQDPIGSYAQPFNGVYNGGCHTIRNVRFQLQEGSVRLYAGLFGYSTGSLRNVVYLMDADNTLTIAKDNGNNLYLGGLAGGSSGSITNCAVAGVNLRGEVYRTTNVYLGGLVGENGGTILNSAAESAMLSASSDNYAYAYAGGLIGSNTASGKVSASYAVGRISTDVGRNSSARVCGFVGSNAGDISGSYAAVNLQSSGSGVETYGFCGEKRGTQSGTFFLNSGNFAYRDTTYNASYAVREETKASPITYQDLTESGNPGYATLSAAGMSLGAKGAYDPNREGASYPYPSGVKDANGNPVHYGRWPQQLDLGIMGVYYWEKLEIEGRTSYDVSLLAVDLETQTVTKQATLSNARSDNGVVTDYGYGYYEAADDGGSHVGLTAAGIHYTANGTPGALLSGATPTDSNVNAQLKQLMPGYTFYSYHSFVPNPTPDEAGIVRAGLYPVGGTDSPNGTVTLSRDGVSATFEINPHFADALALKELPDGWNASAEITDRPGTSEANPYEVRAMGQLSAINWNKENRDTKTVMVGWVHSAVQTDYSTNTTQFPYLSTGDTTGKYVWRQTHDINGNGGVYTPIAEYYTMHKHGDLFGWFGGTFDGDDYVIEDVNIQGQTSSVAGLFGVVFNGTLKNIILYSSDGKGYVTASFDTDKMLSVDYYMGTLAGLAATSSGGTTAIENCSVAGYTINYKTYNVIDNTLGVGKQAGGSGVGGLLGASNMTLKNCSAVTTIRILANPGNAHGNDNLRAGGLVGIAQKNIENCYAGGQITVGGMLDENGEYTKEGPLVLVKGANGLFFGGIVGGNYFERLGGISGGDSSIVLSNCYSYVILPSQKETKLQSTTTQDNTVLEDTSIRALYVLGGKGDGGGSCTITNCYYLESVVMKNNPDGFDTTTVFNGGSQDGNVRRTFSLYTDVPTMITSAEVIVDGGVQEITLTADDVGKIFTIDLATYKTQYTRGLTYGGSSEAGQICRYTTDSTPPSGTPIFVVSSDFNTIQTGTAPAVFKGWVKTFGNATVVATNAPEPMPITYAQLSDAAAIDKNGESKTISYWLSDFHWVTKTTADGFAIPGKYSYACSDDLQGLNYPFPTILTREDGGINVHYGDWPLYGIERMNGGAPIELNLFSSQKKGWTEQLRLSTGIPADGTWEIVTPSSESAAIANAEVGQDGTLTVTGISRGLTEVTVCYTTAGGAYYELPITVRVDAVLQIQPESTPVYLFTGDTTVVRLSLCDELGDPLDPTVLSGLTVNPDKSSCGSNRLLERSVLKKDAEGYYLELTSVSGLEDEDLPYDLESLSINVNYTYQRVEYEDISAINICVVKPTVETDGETGDSLVVTFSLPQANLQAGVKVMSAVADSETGTVVMPDADDNTLGADQLRLEGFAAGDVTVTAELKIMPEGAGDGSTAQKHTVTVVVTIPEPEPEPEPDPGPEVDPELGEGEGESTRSSGTYTATTASSQKPEPEAKPGPAPAQNDEPGPAPEPNPAQNDEPVPAPAPNPAQNEEAGPAPNPEPGQDNELDPAPEGGQEPQAEPDKGTAAGPGLGLEDAQVGETGLKQKMRMSAAVKRLLGAGRKTLHGTNLEKAAQSERGVYSARFAVLSAVRNGGGIGADGSGVQRG